MKTIAVIACADTKYHEIEFVKHRIEETGNHALVVDISTGPVVPIQTDVTREMVLANGNCTLEAIRKLSKSEAISTMGACAAKTMLKLHKEGLIDGVFGMGGLQNTVMCSAALRVLPFGFPKLICSTIACGSRTFDTAVGDKDIAVTPSVVDFAGMNPISEAVLGNAISALIGMTVFGGHPIDTKGEQYIATTLMGITNDTVMRASDLLSARGKHMISFHSTGIGGKVMEDMIRSGFISAVMDLCLHEMTAEYLGNYGYSRGAENRLCAAAEMGIPALIVPGGIDFCCIGKGELLPDEEERGYVWHNSNLTHTRMHEYEILAITDTIINRLNCSKGKTKVLLPMGGLRTMSYPGEFFYKPVTIQKMREMFEQKLKPEISFKAVDMNFCDPEFGTLCADEMESLLK